MRIGSRPAGKYLSASLRAAMRYVACIHGTNAWMPSIFDTLSRSGKNVRSRRASSRCCTGVISVIALLAINTGKIPCSVPVTSIVPLPALISANSRSTYGPSFSVVNWTRMPVSSVNFGSSVFLAHSCSVTGVNWFEVNTTSCAGADRAAPAPNTSMVTPSNDARRRDRITHLLDRDLRNSMMPLFGVGSWRSVASMMVRALPPGDYKNRPCYAPKDPHHNPVSHRGEGSHIGLTGPQLTGRV